MALWFCLPQTTLCERHLAIINNFSVTILMENQNKLWLSKAFLYKNKMKVVNNKKADKLLYLQHGAYIMLNHNYFDISLGHIQQTAKTLLVVFTSIWRKVFVNIPHVGELRIGAQFKNLWMTTTKRLELGIWATHPRKKWDFNVFFAQFVPFWPFFSNFKHFLCSFGAQIGLQRIYF